MRLNSLSTFLFLALLNAFICHASSNALVVQEYGNGFDNDIDNDFENFVADCSVSHMSCCLLWRRADLL